MALDTALAVDVVPWDDCPLAGIGVEVSCVRLLGVDNTADRGPREAVCVHGCCCALLDNGCWLYAAM